jgi:EsV-1-7 cysteine-rich motif
MPRAKNDNTCNKCKRVFANRQNHYRHVNRDTCEEKKPVTEQLQATIDKLVTSMSEMAVNRLKDQTTISDLSNTVSILKTSGAKCKVKDNAASVLGSRTSTSTVDKRIEILEKQMAVVLKKSSMQSMIIDLNEYMADQIAETDDDRNTVATTTESPLSSGCVKVANNVCTEPSCTTSACYGIKNEKASRCAKHAADGMVNVVSKRCIECDDTFVSLSRYDGRCLRCMVYLYPDETVAKGYKMKEKHVGDFIAELHDSSDIIRSYTITFDKSVSGGLSGRRPDIMLDIGTHVVIIEVDENSHNTRAYCSCENKRIMELFEDLKRRPMVVIRFNPDKYKDNLGVSHSSCFGRHASFDVPIIKHKTDWEFRLKLLGEQLLEHSSRVPEKEITVMHLFFDGFV